MTTDEVVESIADTLSQEDAEIFRKLVSLENEGSIEAYKQFHSLLRNVCFDGKGSKILGALDTYYKKRPKVIR